MQIDPEKYKWGLFYFNPKDKRIIVSKVNQMLGWTFNFAHPVTYIVIILFVALLVFVGTR